MEKIGLEIHGYLNTNEKLFCSCKAEHGLKNAKPNTNICPICTAQPGAKPMLPNSEAIKKTIQIALILGCKINGNSSANVVGGKERSRHSEIRGESTKGTRGPLVWQRKHYSWPDLPKGYQNTISGTYAIPVGEKGNFQGIKITECHLEEDPAAWNPKTGEIDYNRSGSPLIEIVTEPDFKSSEQVEQWLKQLIATLSYIKAIDKSAGLKADVNISVDKGKRIEVKNVNSIKNIKKVIEFEIKRQEKNPPKSQETRAFNEVKCMTTKMRDKEQAQDYRFIAEPDLPVIKIDNKKVQEISSKLPETPSEKLNKLIKKHKIEKKYAKILTKKLDLVEFFEEIIEKINPKTAIPWVTQELLSVLNYHKKDLEEVEISPKHFIELLELLEKKTITELKAQEILRKFLPKSFSPKKEISKHKIISNKTEIKKITQKVIKENPKAVQDYKSGKQQSMNFLIGQVMKLSNKRADFKTVKEILKQEI